MACSQAVGSRVWRARAPFRPRPKRAMTTGESSPAPQPALSPRRWWPETSPTVGSVRVVSGYPYFLPTLTLRDAQTKKPGVLVDGGVASPFPVFLFDQPNPAHPTWGFRLFAGTDPTKPSYTDIG